MNAGMAKTVMAGHLLRVDSVNRMLRNSNGPLPRLATGFSGRVP
jgi:hypothetical protein